MRIRTARRDDVPAIVALLAEDAIGVRPEGPASSIEYWNAFDAIESDPRNLLVVGEESDEVVATLQLTFIPGLSRRGGERALIEAVRVRSDLRGRGYGRQLVEWAVDQARQRGCNLVQLTSNKARVDAHRFYASLGFEATHEGLKLAL